jgi:hypothetical protein
MPCISDIDHDLYEMIEELEGRGDLEAGTPAYGIAQQVIHQGYDSLTDKQRFVYDRDIAPLVDALQDEYDMNARMSSAAP